MIGARDPPNVRELVVSNLEGGEMLVTTGKGRLFRRKDGKYLIYVPKDLAEDSMFPFQLPERSFEEGPSSVRVKVSFQMGVKKLLIEKY